MLSEKAKGKQRAVDPIPDGDTTARAPESRKLVIRFTEGVPDLSVNGSHFIGDLKKLIRQERPQLQRRRLRLIHGGRLLTDDVNLHSWLASLEDRQRKNISEASSDKDVTTGSTLTGSTWIHCSVGPAFKPGEEDEDTTQTAQLQPLRGFDRLATAGFSESDIAQFRRTFHTQSSVNYLDDHDFSTDEEYSEYARTLEEQWIDSLDSPLSASASQMSSSSQYSILQGILLGFFFPLLPFFFMREPKPAVFWGIGEWEGNGSVVFSRRMQMGIVVGFLVNLLFGMWRFLLERS